jgi:hypothetical protein
MSFVALGILITALVIGIICVGVYFQIKFYDTLMGLD